MEVIEIARKLGEALKESEEYKTYEQTRAALKSDVELSTKISEYNVQKSLAQSEAEKADKDEVLYDALTARCEILYKEITQNQLMKNYNKAQEDFEMLVTAVNMTIGSYIGSNSYSNGEGEAHGGCAPGGCAHCNGCH